MVWKISFFIYRNKNLRIFYPYLFPGPFQDTHSALRTDKKKIVNPGPGFQGKNYFFEISLNFSWLEDFWNFVLSKSKLGFPCKFISLRGNLFSNFECCNFFVKTQANFFTTQKKLSWIINLNALSKVSKKFFDMYV